EFESQTREVKYAVEVKTPRLIAHRNTMATKSWQLSARIPLKDILPVDQTTLPRDNPVKDFLESASAKFAEYKTCNPSAYRILTIVWDDYIYEPVTALLHPESGLLTT